MPFILIFPLIIWSYMLSKQTCLCLEHLILQIQESMQVFLAVLISQPLFFSFLLLDCILLFLSSAGKWLLSRTNDAINQDQNQCCCGAVRVRCGYMGASILPASEAKCLGAGFCSNTWLLIYWQVHVHSCFVSILEWRYPY